MIGYLSACFATLLAGVFGMSSAGKLRNFSEFARTLEPLFHISERRARLLTIALLLSEGATVVLLAAGWIASRGVTAAGFLMALGLLIAFELVILVEISRGRQMRCLCFGREEAPFGIRHVARNAVLGVSCVAGIISLETQAGLHPAGVIVSLLSGAVLALIVAAMDDLIALIHNPGNT
ncbi:MauE/DoxX family redox-associated membrane protein [Streptosporangium roseum]|uniref:MauE/DoxX family redox-associated membrane protein n=1 Tax=Streptosporangium roseum TaxID=2001 RepID=UPI0004CDBCCB|nr:MauE/DoxX family redox-associated membrane protein [Streptosporangium roseum]